MNVPHFTQPARCAEIDGDAWFPEPGFSGQAAKAVCKRCPAQPECLAYALENEETFGIWGGMSTPERRMSVGLSRKAPVAQRTSAAGNRKERRALTEAERQRIGRLTTQGQSVKQIAEEVDVNPRTVIRVRSELRAAGMLEARGA